MNTPNTPGPWYVEHIGNRPYIVDQPTKNFGIAEVHGITPETAEANARLIAAAPELLSALQHMISAFGPRCEYTEAHFGINTAKAAILKATTPQ